MKGHYLGIFQDITRYTSRTNLNILKNKKIVFINLQLSSYIVIASPTVKDKSPSLIPPK